jgi:type IV pilus assembly protein PilN
MKFQINLASRVYVDTVKVRTLFLVTIFILAVLITVSGVQIVTTHKEIGRLKAINAGLTGATSPRFTDAEYDKVLARIQSVNDILKRRSPDWLGLLTRLEDIVPGGISLRSFDPEKGNAFKVSGYGRNFAAIRNLVERMETSGTFTEVFLLDQAPVKIGPGGIRALSFTLTCKALP